jgi:hypothetical protein
MNTEDRATKGGCIDRLNASLQTPPSIPFSSVLILDVHKVVLVDNLTAKDKIQTNIKSSPVPHL